MPRHGPRSTEEQAREAIAASLSYTEALRRLGPPYEQLVAEIEASSVLAVGRRHGVCDNAIRKWLRAYAAEERRHAERV